MTQPQKRGRAVWKFQLLDQTSIIEMPTGARVLAVQSQHEMPTLWALVDPEAPKERRCFIALGTGREVESEIEGFKYIGTTQIGSLVWHFFEVPS